jgi:hypothetical protein
VCRFGGSKASRGRIPRECSAALQAQGAAGRRYQGSQKTLLLPEARREKKSESGAGQKTSAQENAQGPGLTQRNDRSEELLLPGAALLNPAPTWVSCSRDESYLKPFIRHTVFVIIRHKSKIGCTHASHWRMAGRVQGAVPEGEQYTTCIFGVPPQFFPRGGRAEAG